MEDDTYFTFVETSFFAKTLSELRQNDPQLEGPVLFCLYKRRTDPDSINYDDAMAQALERNNSTHRIILMVSPRLTFLDQWSSLLRVIRSGQGGNGITTVCLAYSQSSDRLAQPVQAQDEGQRLETITRSILQVFQSIPTLEIVDVRVPILPVTVLSSFLDNAPPLFCALALETFSLQESDDMDAFAAAVDRRNKINPVFFQLPVFSASTVELVHMLLRRDISVQTVEWGFSFVMDESEIDDANLRRRILRLLLELLSPLNFSTVHFLKVESEGVFNEISGNIPKNIRGLKISVQGADDWASVADAKHTFLAALKCNVRLLSAEVASPDGVPFWDDAETRKVEFYMHRNDRFLQWAQNPKSLPTNLWPRALRLATEAGHTVLYRCLLSISSDLQTTKRTRKRKRPDRYDPGR